MKTFPGKIGPSGPFLFELENRLNFLNFDLGQNGSGPAGPPALKWKVSINRFVV